MMVDFIIKVSFDDSPEKKPINLNLDNNKKHKVHEELSVYKDNTSFVKHNGSDQNLAIKKTKNYKYLAYVSICEEDRVKIIDKLCIKEQAQLSNSDLMLKLYLKFGEDGFQVLANGFIFILVDYTKKIVLAYRDHIGIKNICYYQKNSSIYLSSAFKYIFDLANQDFTLNMKKIKNFLNLKDESISDTFVNEINKIPPSSFLKFHSNKVYIYKYFEYNLINNPNLPHEQVEGLKKLLKKSTLIDRNNRYSKIGFLFSGGIDSSTIISFFRYFRKTKHQIFSFSAQYKNLNQDIVHLVDESDFQNEINKFDDVNSVSFNGEDESTLSKINFYLDIIGQPFFFPNLYLSNKAFSLAHDMNIGIMVNGNDGDTVISHGYEHLLELFLSFRWINLFKEIDATSKLRKQSRRFIFKRAIADKLNIGSFLKSSAQQKHLEGISSSNHSKAIEIQTLLASYYSIEERYPFYNKHLIEYCLNVSPNLKNKNGHSRYILKEAIKNIVPEKIRKRATKSNLGHALCINFVNKNYEIIEEQLQNPNQIIMEIIDINDLKSSWNNLQQNPRKFATRSSIPSKIFSFVVLNQWLKRINSSKRIKYSTQEA